MDGKGVCRCVPVNIRTTIEGVCACASHVYTIHTTTMGGGVSVCRDRSGCLVASTTTHWYINSDICFVLI